MSTGRFRSLRASLQCAGYRNLPQVHSDFFRDRVHVSLLELHGPILIGFAGGLFRVEAGDYGARQPLLSFHGVQGATGDIACIFSISLCRRSVRKIQYRHMSSSEMDISLPYISCAGS
jgi:hypothetical protein